MTAQAIFYTIFAVFAVYGIYTAARELVIFINRLTGKKDHTGLDCASSKCRGCYGCDDCPAANADNENSEDNEEEDACLDYTYADSVSDNEADDTDVTDDADDEDKDEFFRT